MPEYLNIGVACTDAHLATAAQERVAMIVEDDALGTSQVTYAELAERTARFAQLLRSMGVAAGDRVLIRLPNSIDYATAFLGSLKQHAGIWLTATALIFVCMIADLNVINRQFATNFCMHSLNYFALLEASCHIRLIRYHDKTKIGAL